MLVLEPVVGVRIVGRLVRLDDLRVEDRVAELRHVAEQQRVRLRHGRTVTVVGLIDLDGVLVLDAAIDGQGRRDAVLLEDPVVGELDRVGVERVAVRELDALAQMERDDRVVLVVRVLGKTEPVSKKKKTGAGSPVRARNVGRRWRAWVGAGEGGGERSGGGGGGERGGGGGGRGRRGRWVAEGGGRGCWRG